MSIVIARDRLTIAGPDAERYLQGQLSNDVARLTPGASVWTFLLDPSGKLGHLARIRREAPEEFTLDLESGEAEVAEARLRRFLIRTKLTITTDRVSLDLDGGSGDVLIGWWGHGVHAITSEEPPSNDQQADRLRVEAGWPGRAELPVGLIPGATGVVPVAVSFTKGCYTGQELVARVDSRGNHVPQLLRKVRLSSSAAVGDRVVVDGVEAGHLTSVTGDLALAYVARRVEVPGAAVVAGAPAMLEPQRVEG